MLYRFSQLLTASILFLILAGGLVTSHQAGLAVPDWPLSYGQLMPPMVGNIFWEHGHRMIAGTVGILTLIFAIWIQIQEKRKWVKKIGWLALIAVVLQALLGGLTVLHLLPDAISMSHAVLAQTFFCLVILLSFSLGQNFQTVTVIDETSLKSLRKLSATTLGFIYLQLILGAWVRHSGNGIVFHMIGAGLVFIHILLLASKIATTHFLNEQLVKAAIGLGVLVCVQILLGLGAWTLTHYAPHSYAPTTIRVCFTAAHQTTGAMILGLAAYCAFLAWHARMKEWK